MVHVLYKYVPCPFVHVHVLYKYVLCHLYMVHVLYKYVPCLFVHVHVLYKYVPCLFIVCHIVHCNGYCTLKDTLSRTIMLCRVTRNEVVSFKFLLHSYKDVF